MGIALMLLMLVFFLFLGNLLFLSFSVNSLKYTSDAIGNVKMLEYAVADSDRNSNEILAAYNETTLNKLQFAGMLYEKGLFETDPARVRAILGDDTYYYLLDPEGKLLEGQKELPISDAELQNVFSLVSNDDQWVPYIIPEYSAFFHKLSNGGYILSLCSSSREDTLLDSLYDSKKVISMTSTNDGFAIGDMGGTYYAGPEELMEHLGEDVKDVLVPITSKAGDETSERVFYLGHIDDELYIAAERPSSEESTTGLYYLIRVGNILKESFVLAGGISMAVVFGAILIVYFIYQYRKANPNETPLTIKDRKIKTRILTVVVLAFTGLVTYYMRTLFGISSNVLDDDKELLSVIDFCEQREESARILDSIFTNLYSEQTEMIGRYLTAYPEERTEEELKKLSGIFGLEYMILFDQDGNEILSDADYINLSLSKNKNDMSWKFRSLLNGTKILVSGIEKDDLTGLTHQVIGVQLRDRDNQPDGLMTCGYSSEFISKVLEENSANSVLAMKSDIEKNDYYLIDPETNTVIFSPNNFATGIPAEDFGFTETVLEKGYSGTLHMYGQKYSATQAEMKEDLLYVLLPYEEIFGSRFNFSFSVCTGALVVILISSFLFNRVKIKEGLPEENRISPEEKTTRTLVYLARISGVILALVLVFRKYLLAPDSIINYVMEMKWRPGMNVFALTAVLILILLATIGVRFIRYMLNLLTQVSSPSAETYFRLLRSSVEYLSVIIIGYSAMQMLGANMTALMTTTGAMTLLVGMGAQDLTSDIIAGLFLMFESEFQVGDVIDVGGKIGTVKEIGLHATKLIDEDNNILILNNSNVRNVINRTQNSSFLFITFTLSTDIPIHELEELFKAELPKLRVKYPQLLSDPYFKGAEDFSGGSMECTIAAETNESDRVKMERALNQEVQKILTDHGITIG